MGELAASASPVVQFRPVSFVSTRRGRVGGPGGVPRMLRPESVAERGRGGSWTGPSRRGSGPRQRGPSATGLSSSMPRGRCTWSFSPSHHTSFTQRAITAEHAHHRPRNPPSPCPCHRQPLLPPTSIRQCSHSPYPPSTPPLAPAHPPNPLLPCPTPPQRQRRSALLGSQAHHLPALRPARHVVRLLGLGDRVRGGVRLVRRRVLCRADGAGG